MSVFVSDSGPGIEAKDIDRLFSRFGKLHRTAELNNEGIGLGLTIVKQIVQASEGTINVFSEGKGKGSIFYFTMKLPIYKDDYAFDNFASEDEISSLKSDYYL